MNTPRPVSSSAPDSNARAVATIVRPRFFAGQLLSDLNLTGLTDWTRDRLALVRYRHGWGVVCGLDVWSPACNRSLLTVGAGYAVSCGGDDLFVAGDLSFDLTQVSQGQAVVTDTSGAACVVIEGASPSPNPPDDPFFHIPADQLRKFDIYLRALATNSTPQPAPRRGSCCSDATACNYTQSLEDVELVALTATDPPPPSPLPSTPPTPYNLWKSGFQAWTDDITTFLGKFPDPSNVSDAAAQALADRITAKARHFPFLAAWLEESPLSKDRLLATLFWLVIDERATLLAKLSWGCSSCKDIPGVPLARVWLQVQTSAVQPSCQILAVSTGMPYRRPIHADDRWPAPPGSVNLGSLIGARSLGATTGENIQCAVAARDLIPKPEMKFPLNGLDDVKKLTSVDGSGLIQTSEDPVLALVFPDAAADSNLVVAFQRFSPPAQT
jgi:hypothetical protein